MTEVDNTSRWTPTPFPWVAGVGGKLRNLRIAAAAERCGHGNEPSGIVNAQNYGAQHVRGLVEGAVRSMSRPLAQFDASETRDTDGFRWLGAKIRLTRQPMFTRGQYVRQFRAEQHYLGRVVDPH